MGIWDLYNARRKLMVQLIWKRQSQKKRRRLHGRIKSKSKGCLQKEFCRYPRMVF